MNTLCYNKLTLRYDSIEELNFFINRGAIIGECSNNDNNNFYLLFFIIVICSLSYCIYQYTIILLKDWSN